MGGGLADEQGPSGKGATNLPEYGAHAESLPLETFGGGMAVPEDHLGVQKGVRMETEV